MMPAFSFLCVPALLFFMFIPTLIELRKPKDAGPRLIIPALIKPTPIHTIPPKHRNLIDLEEPLTLDVTLKPFLDVIFSAWQTNEIEN